MSSGSSLRMAELLFWASELDEERLWAAEERCRRLTHWLERRLLAAGEQLVRVPPKLIAAGAARWQSAREV
jgi:hypothetical protein